IRHKSSLLISDFLRIRETPTRTRRGHIILGKASDPYRAQTIDAKTEKEWTLQYGKQSLNRYTTVEQAFLPGQGGQPSAKSEQTNTKPSPTALHRSIASRSLARHAFSQKWHDRSCENRKAPLFRTTLPFEPVGLKKGYGCE